MSYDAFLATKRIVAPSAGFGPKGPLSSHLFGFQADVVGRALTRGRSAIFADCGMGKSLMELEWAHQVHLHTKRPVLILEPLSVVKQFGREAEKFGYDKAKVCFHGEEIKRSKIVISNYEKLHLFNPKIFSGIALGESGILKSFDGTTRKQITAFAKAIPYRLAASATPAPNDLIELTNHAEFLDVMTGKEIIATFFTQDGNTATKFRLKKHSHEAFWAWLATWCTALRKPSDIGYSDEGYILPPMVTREHISASAPADGSFLPNEAATLTERRIARRVSMSDRVAKAIELAHAEPDQQFLIWCDLNDEQDQLKAALGDECVSIQGTTPAEHREQFEAAWIDGRRRILISKPSICGHGLNFQHCARMIFVGLSDSFESQYQAKRRCWRFGQSRPVHVHLIASEAEGAVMANLKRKEDQATEMFDQLVKHMTSAGTRRAGRDVEAYDPTVPMILPTWLQPEMMA